MFKKLRKKAKSQKGFSLIELLIAIAILGVIAAIAVPNVSGYLASSKKKADVATANTIASATVAAITLDSSLLPSSGTTIVNLSKTTYTADSAQDKLQDAVVAKIQGGAPNAQYSTANKFWVSVSSVGAVKVGVVGNSTDDSSATELFPEVNSDYK